LTTELTVLGCHGGETPKHRTTSFLLGGRVAIDAGAITGTLSLEEQHRIQSVLVSHPHIDHVRDLATLADNRCQQGGPPLEIVGTPASLRDLQKHFFNNRLWPDFTEIETSQGPTITYRTIRPETTSDVGGFGVTPILVTHTIETCGFLIESPSGGSIAYSGDTGPTERFWEHLNACKDLRALLMEVSFPSDHAALARASGHHTPDTLKTELKKLDASAELPILLYHIKPVFYAQVVKELAKIKGKNLTIVQLEDQFAF
jgi:3',5'-cyclic-nucleotide phosphodiesterase